MKNTISTQHKQQFEEMKKSLTTIGYKEGNFIKVELLFYNAVAIAREYGDDVHENDLLASLKQLQAKEYENTKTYFRKNVQREQAIRKFSNGLKSILTAGAKDAFFHPQLT